MRGLRFTTEDEVNEAYKANMATLTKFSMASMAWYSGDESVSRLRERVLNNDIIIVISGKFCFCASFMKEKGDQYTELI